MASLFSKRFAELADQFASVQATIRVAYDPVLQENRQTLDEAAFGGWCIKVKSLLDKVCGPESVEFREFHAAITMSYFGAVELAKYGKAAFDAARENFDGGYLSSVRNMVRAEVFGSELEQAEELLKSGYAAAAAVIAGTVLETTLRDLCAKHGIAPSTSLDAMNSALAKASEYSNLVQKQVTAMAGVRNAAAHGDKIKFRAEDVEPMIREIGRFIDSHPVI
jgi:hypothetical protein